jgi:hypothetical protein
MCPSTRQYMTSVYRYINEKGRIWEEIGVKIMNDILFRGLLQRKKHEIRTTKRITTTSAISVSFHMQ